jgi:D-glycero-alpha-D-manno-heptose-7-phosphate kinase
VAANAHPAICLADGMPPRQASSDRVVIAVAPLRVDLTGGFTDIPPFSSSVDSLHINAAFDLTVSVRCQTRRDGRVRVGFSWDGKQASTEFSEGRRRFLEAVRAGVAEFAGAQGLDLSITSEAPAGSGLGSSGAILVAAISGCAKLAGVPLTAPSTAKKAIDAAATVGIVGGQQDEFAAAHGSLRAYLFERGGPARIQDLAMADACKYLEDNFLVVQMGAEGRRTDVVAEVVKAVRSADQETIGVLLRLQELAHNLWEVMNQGRFEELPGWLGRIREAQCALHPGMCCPIAADAMEAIRHAIAGSEYKILGGGGAGSCVLLHVPVRRRAAAISLLGNRATRVFALKIKPFGVLAEFAHMGENAVSDGAH